ncbi:MAG TPA: TonB-dependent receptor, partial [Pyrinomonadaceae bacterium]|nr:TonB-dependent receptor [Pyrinomonadaceae bacterium]
VERPERKYNRYGATVNGPIFKNRTFFLFAYERQKDNVAQPFFYSVPTMLMRDGNFSELTYPIYDPNTAVQGGNGCTGTNVCRTAFTGNIIPQARIYAPAQSLLRMLPEPNLAGLTENYRTDRNLIRPYRSYTVKIDHNFNANNKISGNWYHSRNTEDRYNITMEPESIFQGFENRRNFGTNVNYTSTLSNDFIFDLRGSLAQFKLRRYQVGQPSAGELGFTGIPSDRQDHLFPRFNFQNYMTIGSERADWNEGRERPFTVFTLQPTLTQIFGNHTLKYGYDFRRLNEKFFTAGYAAGQFTFNGAFTMQASNSGGTEQNRPGRDIASFLLGIPAAGSSIDNPTDYDVSSLYHGFFVQDDFRVRTNLTFNLGLRFDVESGYREKEGRIIVDFDRTAVSPIAAQVLANFNSAPPAGVPIDAFQELKGGFIFAGDSSGRSQKADKNNWQPRIGVSWALDNKTVLRAGFGIFTAPFQLVTQNIVFQPGFSSPEVITQSSNGLAPLTTLANPFGSGVTSSPGTAQGLLTFTGRNVTATNAAGPTTYIPSHDRKNANYSRFIIGVQREIFFGIGAELTYVYSRGSDLLVLRDINAVPRQYLNNLEGVTDGATILNSIDATNTFLNFNVATNTNPFRGTIPDGGDWNGPRILRERLLVPFPQFGYLTTSEYNGSSEYQSVQIQFMKRFTKGLSLNGSYSFSREHEKTRYLNPQDEELSEMVSPTERPHRFTFSGIYELPLGKGRQFGNDWHPVVDGILGGWQMQAVYEWQSGEPLMFGNVFYAGDPSQLKNLLGKKDSEGRRYGIDIPGWDVTGFRVLDNRPTLPNGQTNPNFNQMVLPAFGNNFQANATNTLRYFPLTMGQFRNQRFLKFDVGLSKNFRIREGMKLQVRVEAINLLNSPYFNAPNLDPGNASFGKTTGQRQPPRDIQIGGRFTF